MKTYAKKESEMLIKVVPTPKDLHKHYQFWCYMCLILTLIHSAGFPSFYSLINLIICITVVCFWFHHYKIEEQIFAVVSYIILIGTTLYVFVAYFIFIDFIYIYNIPKFILVLIGIPYLETSTNVYVLLNLFNLLLMAVTASIYQRMRRRILKMQKLRELKEREKLLRNFGQAFTDKVEDQKNPFILIADLMKKERKEKQRKKKMKLEGTYKKQSKTRLRQKKDTKNLHQILLSLNQQKKKKMQMKKEKKEKKEKREMEENERKKGWFQQLRQVIMNFFYSVSFSMHICRVLLIVWILLYTSIPSFILLIMLFHSMLSRRGFIFLFALRYIYLPYVIILLLYHHAFNSIALLLPSDFFSTHNKYELWNYDLRVYRYPFLEFALQIATFYLICVRINMGTQEKKNRVLPNESNWFIQICFWFLNHMDTIVVIVTFFVGIKEPDLYHLGLLVFFLFYILYVNCMRKTFFFFQLYIQLFALIHYAYVILRFYYRAGSSFDQWLKFIGFGTSYDTNAEYFAFDPSISQWVLIFLTFIQMRVYLNKQDDQELSNQNVALLSRQFYDSHPKCSSCLYITGRYFQINIIWFSYAIFFMILVLDHKSVAEYINLLLVLILILIQVGGSFQTPFQNELRLRKWWWVLIAYSSFYLFVICAFQLVYSKDVDFSAKFAGIVDSIPEAIKTSADILGFYELPSPIVVSLLGKVVFVLLGVHVYRYLGRLHEEENKMFKRRNKYNRLKESGENFLPLNKSDTNSDYDDLHSALDQGQSYDLEDQTEISLKDYVPYRVDTQYFVYKCKMMWPVLDFICRFFFEFLAFMVMMLSLVFRFAFSFFLSLVFLTVYQISVHVSLYRQNVLAISQIREQFTYNDLDVKLEQKSHDMTRLKHRSIAWALLASVTGVMILFSYPSQFLYEMQANPAFANFAGALRETIWISFYLGDTYPEATSGSYFAYTWGYYFLLVLLVLQRKAQTWVFGRYQVDDNFKLKRVRTTRQQILYRKRKEEINLKMSLLAHLQKQNPLDPKSPPQPLKLPTLKLTQKLPSLPESRHEEESEFEREKEKVRQLMFDKYLVGLGRGVKGIIEHTLMYLLVVACIVKANFFSLCYFFSVFIVNSFIQNSTKQMAIYTVIISVFFCVQYLLMLENLNPLISTKTMPDDSWKPFDIPWYTKISGDQREVKDWAYFFQLGNETIQRNQLWFEVVMLFILMIYFHFFCEKYYEINQAQLFCDSMDEIKKQSENEKKEMNGFLKTLGLEQLGEKQKDESKPAQLFDILLKQRRTTLIDRPRSQRTTLVHKHSASADSYGGPFQVELSVRNSLTRQMQLPDQSQESSQDYIRKSSIAQLIQAIAKPLNSKKTSLPPEEIKKIKEKLPIRTCYRTCRYMVFLFMQFFTLCIILTLSVSNSGFLTLIYTLFSLYYIYQARSFYEEEGAKNWSFPRILKYLIFPYIQLDLFAQLIYQIPFDFSYEQQNNPYSVTRIIGIFQMWFYDSNLNLVRLGDLVGALVLKALIYIIISIQLRIFKSNEYKEFIFKELYKARGDNRTRGICMAYQFNNNRLQTECEISEEKYKLVLNLDLLRQRLYEWNKINFQDRGFGGFRQPTLYESDKLKTKASEKNKISASEQEQKEENYITIDLNNEESVRNAALSQASTGVRFYVWMYRNLTNPLLLQKGNLLQKSKESLYKGRLKAMSEIEYILMSHYRVKTIYKRKMLEYEEEVGKIYEEEERWAQEHRDALGLIDFPADKQDEGKTRLAGIAEEEEGGKGQEDQERKEEAKESKDVGQPIESRFVRKIKALQKPEMPKTEYKEKTSCPHMCRSYIYCLFTILVAHTDFFCYLMMLVNHMVNGNLISFFYPVLILGYALFENPRPSALFWKIVLLYAEFVIFLKFVLRFAVWGLMADQLESYHDSYKLGIEFSFASSQQSFFTDIVVDTLTIMAVLLHQFVLISLGVWNKKEPELESVTDAIKRLLELRKNEKKVMSIFNSFIRKAIGQDAEEKRNDVLLKRAQSQIVEMYHPDEQSDSSEEGSDEDSIPEDAEAMQEEGERKLVRFYSDSNLNILENAPESQIHQWFSEMKALHHQELSSWKRFVNRTEEAVFNCGYLSKLFPKIRQEKPGQDFFAYMILPLFIAIIFVIFFYAKMAAEYSSNIAQTLSYNQFSAGMVLFVLFQIAHIVLERYLYLQQKSLVLGAKEVITEDEDQDQDDSQSKSAESKVAPSVISYSRFGADRSQAARRQATGTVESMSVLTSAKTNLMRNQSSSNRSGYFKINEGDDDAGVYKHIQDKVTYIDRDFSQCWKLLLHWALILFIHFMFFWYYPITGNIALQGHKWCDTQAKGVGCNEFQSNWALIIAYLLYLFYFVYSAVQIRTGHPQIRDMNSLTKQDKNYNKWIFQGYLAIPFLWELRTITDWTFTKTALDLFQWFKFEDIYNTLYTTKVTTKSYRAHKLGAPRALIFKIIQGGCMLLGLLLLIVAPMIIFSGLNPIAQKNNVTGAQIAFRLQLNGTNTYTLFRNSHVSFIETFNQGTFDYLNFTQNADLRAYPLDQLQIVETNQSSDSNWEITPSNTGDVQKYLQGLDRSNIAKNTVHINMDYQFERPEPAGKQAVVKSAPFSVNETNFNIVGELIKAFDPNVCQNRTIELKHFYMPTIRLTSNVKPKVIWTDLWQDITLSLTCLIHTVNITGSSIPSQRIIDRYWNAYTDPSTTSAVKQNFHMNSNNNGIVFYTASDKVTSQLIQYSVLTFYISIVLVVGRYLRGFFSKGAEQVILKEMPFPDDLLLICESVVSSRLENKLEREEELYYVLIDIMRSPEMIKAITKSSLRKQD